MTHRQFVWRADSAAGIAGESERGYPGQQVEGDLDDLQPELVLRGTVAGEVAQAGVGGCASRRRR
jgi:hypothetical protein